MAHKQLLVKFELQSASESIREGGGRKKEQKEGWNQGKEREVREWEWMEGRKGRRGMKGRTAEGNG